MSSYNLGMVYLRRLLTTGDALEFHRQRLDDGFFKGAELPVYLAIKDHFSKYKVLPDASTLAPVFPEFYSIPCPEPLAYYGDQLFTRHAYDSIGKANLQSQNLLHENKESVLAALELLEATTTRLRLVQQRTSMVDIGKDAAGLVLKTYQAVQQGTLTLSTFGWPYMDNMCGGLMAGDVVSIAGRPAAGKTWLLLYMALHNWLRKLRVLFVSMEMSNLAISQRVLSMYTHTPFTQLKTGAFSTQTMKKFGAGISQLGAEQGKLFVIDGKLALCPEDVYGIAQVLEVDAVCIDGAYLMGNKNKRLNRNERVAENVETIKRFTDDVATVASWQLSRGAVESKKAGNPQGKTKSRPGLEHIGYSDAIGQVSSIVMSLDQDDSPETIHQRVVSLMKGRDGQIGEFAIKWEFEAMDFGQVEKTTQKELEFI